MNSARWARVRAILEGALELDGADRSAHLTRECGGDLDLRHEVESLLSVDARGDELRPPESEELARAIEDPDIGRRVGPFVLERRLGAGGMGVVYLARRIDADFEQRVALKLIKRGMDSDEILTQFRRERALLAGLEHPCIARLLDGGSTEDGRPWLAMEHVEGRPIDAWCEEQGLTIRGRVELLLCVTSAVRHAHQRLIVHRDLKPSNILVARDGTPKLLDFGIARLLAAPSESSPSRTAVDRRRLTPDYASPEQFHDAVVTTASDVYSLGVILYELLTGENPIRGVDVERRTDPERPSTRLRLSRAQFDRAMAVRGRELRGDLDTIVLTALALEPARRYPSAEALELDLRRYLQGFPIEARPATASYRLRKFVGRNRLAVAAIAAVATSVVIGLALARAGYLEAVEQRTLAETRQDRAEKEARRADAVLRLTREMLAGASPHDVKDRDYTLRQLLDRFDARLEVEPAGEPEVEASVRQIMATSYRELGMLDRAERHVERAFELLPDARTSNEETRIALVNARINLLHDRGDYSLAESECDALIARLRSTGGSAKHVTDLLVTRGDLRTHLARHEEAEADLRTALAELEAAVPMDYRSTITCLASLVGIEQRRRDTTRALELAERALGLARAHMGERGAQTARMLNSKGHVLLGAGRFADAERTLREAVAIERELRESDDHARAPSLTNLGRALTGLGRYREAEPILREAIDLSRKGLGPKHPSLASDLGNLGSLLDKLGDYAGAESVLRESLEIRVEVFGEHSVEVARARNNLGVLLRSMGRGDESEQELRRALATRRALGGERDVSVASTLGSLGTTLVSLERLDEAETCVRECLAIFRESLGPSHVDLASCLVSLSVIRLRRNDHGEARRLAEEALAMRVELLGPTHPDVARSLTGLGEILAACHELVPAEQRLREALAMQRELLGDAHPSLARTLFQLGDVAERTARPIEARDYLREALSIWRKSSGDAGRETREAGARLAALLEVTGDLDGASALRRELGLTADENPATRSH